MRWPDQLVHDVAARRAILFIGAGVSMNSLGADGKTRPKSWAQFLSAGAKKLGGSKKKIVKELNVLIENKDLLTACEVIKNEMGRQDFVDFMKAEFQAPGFRYAPIHEILWSLDLRITITPNVDNIYDGLVVERGNGTVTLKTYKDDDIAESIRRRERVLIKSHGSIGAPNDLIFTRSDYARARGEHREFYELLYALLSTHTFIFVGCGLDDPDIRFLLEDYRYRNSFTQRHYFTLPNDSYVDKIKKVFSDSLNLDFITYSSERNHEALRVGLDGLREVVEFARQDMGRRGSW
jgi:SIR2-like domain